MVAYILVEGLVDFPEQFNELHPFPLNYLTVCLKLFELFVEIPMTARINLNIL